MLFDNSMFSRFPFYFQTTEPQVADRGTFEGNSACKVPLLREGTSMGGREEEKL